VSLSPVLPPRPCPNEAGGNAEMLMWISPDRIFYAGLLGKPGMRAMGSLMIYVATQGRIRIAVGGGDWQVCDLAVVHPYEPHQLLSEAPLINLIKIEAETLDIAALPALLATSGRRRRAMVRRAGAPRTPRVRCRGWHARTRCGRLRPLLLRRAAAATPA